MVWSFVYLAVRNLFAPVWLLARPRRSKELEILVLRHLVQADLLFVECEVGVEPLMELSRSRPA